MPSWSWRRWVVTVVVGGLALFILLVGVAYAFAKVPKASDVAGAHSTLILDRKGRQIARLHADVDRVDIPISQMPKILQDATIAAEDHGFYTHGGVSIPAIVRAGFADILHLGAAQGGSTITQQYVKNAYVGNQRTIFRKIKEAIVAVKLERSTSKQQILERYLNTVYFGRGAYGVQAAAQAFFGKNASQLTLPEAAYLAGAIRSPETYAADHAAGLRRRNDVLDQMVKLRFVSADQADAAKNTPITFVARRARSEVSVAPYFVEDVRQALVRQFGTDEVYRGGLRVTTTLDLDMQRYAEQSVATVLDQPTDPDAALVAVDPKDGSVRAEVGGRDFNTLQVNVATNTYGRQPGSSFKPFVLAAAVKSGMSVNSTFRAPATITIPTGFQPWTVSNYDHHDYGTLNVIQATEESVNTVYAQIITKVGPDLVVQAAHDAGIKSHLPALPSLTLGTANVTPMEMAGAYDTFAAAGTHHDPYTIVSVVDRKGRTLYASHPKAELGLPSGVANTVTYAMQKVIQDGTGRPADIGRPAAGKTGTTENHVDAWFGGFTPDLVAVVWMGYPQGGRTMENVRGIAVVGASFPARIWHDFMVRALANTPPHDFPKPDLTGQTIVASPTSTVSASPSPSPSRTVPTSLPSSLAPSPTSSPNPGPSHSQSPSPSPSPTGAGTQAPQGGGG